MAPIGRISRLACKRAKDSEGSGVPDLSPPTASVPMIPEATLGKDEVREATISHYAAVRSESDLS